MTYPSNLRARKSGSFLSEMDTGQTGMCGLQVLTRGNDRDFAIILAAGNIPTVPMFGNLATLRTRAELASGVG